MVMNQLLFRKTWERKPDEDIEQFRNRTEEQKRNLYLLKKQRGPCFMVKFGDDDIRPMWADQIEMQKLMQEIRTPVGSPVQCPLCQPYDAWDGFNRIDENRRMFCKVVDPKYHNGCADEIGVYAKCVCLMSITKRGNIPFKGV